MATRRKKVTKELVFVFEYRVSPEDLEGIPEILEKMRETGAAEIVDIELEEVEEKKS